MNRQRFIFTIILVLLLALPGYTSPLYMWHISHNDAYSHAEMYMLGSIHILSEDFYPLPGVIDDLSYQADLLVLEADIRKESGMSSDLLQLTLEHGYYHDGSGLEDHLPSDLYQDLSALIADRGMPMAAFSLMRPWLLALTLQVLELESSGYLAELGMEQVLVDRHEGEIAELEGVVFQLKLLSGLSDKDQLELLESAVDETGNAAESMELFTRAWRKGAPELLENEISGDLAEDLIFERNINMADKAAELLSGYDGTILLVIGAAHFVGELGLPALMSERGFAVSQVMSDGSLTPFLH